MIGKVTFASFFKKSLTNKVMFPVRESGLVMAIISVIDGDSGVQL